MSSCLLERRPWVAPLSVTSPTRLLPHSHFQPRPALPPSACRTMGPRPISAVPPWGAVHAWGGCEDLCARLVVLSPWRTAGCQRQRRNSNGIARHRRPKVASVEVAVRGTSAGARRDGTNELRFSVSSAEICCSWEVGGRGTRRLQGTAALTGGYSGLRPRSLVEEDGSTRESGTVLFPWSLRSSNSAAFCSARGCRLSTCSCAATRALQGRALDELPRL